MTATSASAQKKETRKFKLHGAKMIFGY